MSPDIRHEITVWTDGEEGRFHKWEDGIWKAFEHHNYRHSFSPAQPITETDLRRLREIYRISASALADYELIRSSPYTLAQIGGRNW